MDKRKFLKCTAYICSFLLFPIEQAIAFPLKKELRALPYFLDILLPETDSPSATQLGIHMQLLKHSRNIENYPVLLTRGCKWLDLTANEKFNAASFEQLTEQQKINIIELAERGNKDSISRIFFARIKQDAFWFYYSNPATWESLGFKGPPQPNGFPKHTFPPQILGEK